MQQCCATTQRWKQQEQPQHWLVMLAFVTVVTCWVPPLVSQNATSLPRHHLPVESIGHLRRQLRDAYLRRQLRDADLRDRPSRYRISSGHAVGGQLQGEAAVSRAHLVVSVLQPLDKPRRRLAAKLQPAAVHPRATLRRKQHLAWDLLPWCPLAAAAAVAARIVIGGRIEHVGRGSGRVRGARAGPHAAEARAASEQQLTATRAAARESEARLRSEGEMAGADRDAARAAEKAERAKVVESSPSRRTVFPLRPVRTGSRR